MYSLNWLQRFLKGELDVSKLWAPNFNVSFIRPNKITGTLPENPFNVVITKPDFSVKPRKITFKPTANNIESNIGGNPDINNGITPFAFDRPYFPLTDFNQYEGAMLSPIGNIGKRTNPLWGVYDVRGNINKFLMYGTEHDVHSMHLFEKMLEENDLKNKYQLITVEYPKFISVIEEGLPDNVIDDFYEIRGNNKDFSRPLLMPYTTTPIRTSGAIWVEEDAGVNERFLENSDFTNNPITEDEWDEVLALVQDINNNDFIFDDFERSLILRRNSAGQLVLGFTKYKYTPLATDNYTDAIEMGRKLERAGLKANQNGVVKKSSKPTKQDVAKILNGVTRAEIVVTEYDSGKMVVHAVWRLYHQNDIVGYLKYGTEEEIINTRKAEKVFTENNLVERFNKYINVKYSRILADNADDLPPEILKKVYEEFDANKAAIRNADDRAKKIFILSPVDTDVFCWGNLGNDLQSIYTALARLGGRPIKAEAWGEFFDLMLELEKAGVYYGDAYNNIGFKGKVGEKLDVIYTDFEDEGIANALKEVQNLGNSLNAYGLKEPNFYTDNVDLENLPF